MQNMLHLSIPIPWCETFGPFSTIAGVVCLLENLEKPDSTYKPSMLKLLWKWKVSAFYLNFLCNYLSKISTCASRQLSYAIRAFC